MYDFLAGLQVDFVPKGCAESPLRPFGHWLCTRVQALEAQPEVSAEDVSTVVGVQPLLENNRKRLKIVWQSSPNIKRTQLTFYDELRVFDPRQLDSMPKDIKNYPNLFTADEMEVLCASGEWKLYWKQRFADDLDFDVLQWWERAQVQSANMGWMWTPNPTFMTKPRHPAARSSARTAQGAATMLNLTLWLSQAETS